MIKYKDGALHIRQHAARDLVKSFGSPLYVYDEQILRERCRQILALADGNCSVYYSAKANSTVQILKIIRSEGLKIDVVSLGELYLAQLAGFKQDEILFMSNNINNHSLEVLSQMKIKVCIDSISELKQALTNNYKFNILLRVNNNITSGHHEKVKTGGAVKFGIEVDQLDEAFELAEKYEKPIFGLCSHIGSFFLDYEEYHKNLVATLKLAEKYQQIKYLDFGGGFGIPYDRKNQTPFPIESYTSIFNNTISEWKIKNNRNLDFGIQPGRFIVAESAVTLSTVQSIKNNYGAKFVGVDLGFNFFPRPILYDAYHEVMVDKKQTTEGKSKEQLCSLAGNLCESGDILVKNIYLDNDIKIDDIIAFRDTGAYCFSMSSNYLSMPRPAEVLIRENGTILQIRKPETLDYLIKGQIYV